MLRQFFHVLLEGLQSLRDLRPQQLGNRGFDSFLDNLQPSTCVIELIPELLSVARSQFLKNRICSALKFAARTGYRIAGHSRQARVQVRLKAACRFVQLRYAAAKISDLPLQV